MSNPIFNLMHPSAPQPAPQQGNFVQNLFSFARTLQGNPEQMVRGLLDSGKMSQQQFNQYSQIAQQMLPRKK